MPQKGEIGLKYAKISFDTRVQFLYEVLERGKSVAKASKRAGICLSTAKLIVKKFKETGQIFDKNMTKYQNAAQNEEEMSLDQPLEQISEEKSSLMYQGPNVMDNKDQVAQNMPQAIGMYINGYYYAFYPTLTFQTL